MKNTLTQKLLVDLINKHKRIRLEVKYIFYDYTDRIRVITNKGKCDFDFIYPDRSLIKNLDFTPSCFIPDGHEALSSVKGVKTVMNIYPELLQCMPIEIEGLCRFQISHDSHILGDNNVYNNIEEFLDNHVE